MAMMLLMALSGINQINFYLLLLIMHINLILNILWSNIKIGLVVLNHLMKLRMVYVKIYLIIVLISILMVF